VREVASPPVGVERAQEDPQVLSPELVLVSSPEDTQDARAQLPHSPPWRAVRSGQPQPRQQASRNAQSSRSKRRNLRIAGLVALAIVGLGAAGYVAERHWGDNGSKTAVPIESTFVPAHTWAWGPANGAKGYEVTFFREGRIVFRARPTEPRVVMPSSFRFEAGNYRWTVRALPVVGGARPIVDSTFFLTSAGAAEANHSSR
jgi:hypothetical protein